MNLSDLFWYEILLAFGFGTFAFLLALILVFEIIYGLVLAAASPIIIISERRRERRNYD